MSAADYEKQVVEAILKDNTVYYLLGIQARDFENQQHRAVFKTIERMLEKNLEVSERTLLEFNSELSGSKMFTYDPTTSANAEYYANGLKARTRKRELVALAKDLVKQAEQSRDTREVIDWATTELLRVAEHRAVQFRKVGDCLLSVLEKMERAYHSKERDFGLKTGFHDFDRLGGGFNPGELVIIAARTSIGKTTLALNMAENMARAGHSLVFFSCEMTDEEVGHRLLSGIGNVPHQKVRAKLLNPRDFSGITDAAGIISEMEFWIDDTPSIKWADLRNKARVLRTRGIECVFVDYLTLVRYGDPRTPRHERVGMLTQELKALARELEVPVVVLSQLNRGAEHQGGKSEKPNLSQLRQSGEIEENADIVMLLDRDREDEEKPADLHVAKYRGGPTGHVQLRFEPDRTRFCNMTRRQS